MLWAIGWTITGLCGVSTAIYLAAVWRLTRRGASMPRLIETFYSVAVLAAILTAIACIALSGHS